MTAQDPSKPRENDDAATATDSLDLILDTARRGYEQQIAAFESHRARAGTLLAFAAVLVTFSAATSPSTGHAPTHAAGTACVLLAAVLFLVASSGSGLRLVPTIRWLKTAEVGDGAVTTKERLLRSILAALEANRRPLARLEAFISIGLLWLLLGTTVSGVRFALLLL
jgi:hypothetical protein